MSDLPVWGQLSLFGFSLSINVYFATMWIRGKIVSLQQLETAMRMADTWQKGWETSQANETRLGEAVVRLTGLTDVFEHFINSLPALEEAIEGDNHVQA